MSAALTDKIKTSTWTPNTVNFWTNCSLLSCEYRSLLEQTRCIELQQAKKRGKTLRVLSFIFSPQHGMREKGIKQIAGTLLFPINLSLWQPPVSHLHSLYLLSAALMSVHSIQSIIRWSHCLQVQIDVARKELKESSGCFLRHPLPVWTCCRIAQNAGSVLCDEALF